MSSQSWEQLINPVAVADGTAYNTSTSLTDVNPTPNTVIPANYLQPGSMLRVTARAKFSNTSTPTLLLGIYYGGVAGTKLCAIGATTTTTGATNWPIQVEALINVRTISYPDGCVCGRNRDDRHDRGEGSHPWRPVGHEQRVEHSDGRAVGRRVAQLIRWPTRRSPTTRR